jgi:hypothetical protein
MKKYDSLVCELDKSSSILHYYAFEDNTYRHPAKKKEKGKKNKRVSKDERDHNNKARICTEPEDFIQRNRVSKKFTFLFHTYR